jgi:hypothetical protein
VEFETFFLGQINTFQDSFRPFQGRYYCIGSSTSGKTTFFHHSFDFEENFFHIRHTGLLSIYISIQRSYSSITLALKPISFTLFIISALLTLAESLKIAALSFKRDISGLSCCV